MKKHIKLEGRQKIEAVAEINYSESLLAFNNANFENALAKNTEAENMYSTLNSKEWLIKIAIQKTEILIKQKIFLIQRKLLVNVFKIQRPIISINNS